MQSMIGDRLNVNLSKAYRVSTKLLSHVPRVRIRTVTNVVPDGLKCFLLFTFNEFLV
jgi:hypothetical protein